MKEIADLISEYGVIIVTATLFIAAAVLIFWQNQKEKQDLQDQIYAHTVKTQEKLDKLEEFQRVELVEINKSLTVALEQTQICLKDSTDALNKVTEILIIAKAKGV